jgi:hypothetical protein
MRVRHSCWCMSEHRHVRTCTHAPTGWLHATCRDDVCSTKRTVHRTQSRRKHSMATHDSRTPAANLAVLNPHKRHPHNTQHTRTRTQHTHLHGPVAVGSEVLGLQADGQAAPQAARHAHKHVPARARVCVCAGMRRGGTVSLWSTQPGQRCCSMWRHSTGAHASIDVCTGSQETAATTPTHQFLTIL